MRNAFSMIELVFVIVIIGIIAAIAIPRLSITRSDAQYVALQSDIQTVLSAVQSKSLTDDITPTSLNGDLIMEVAGLNPTKWIATSTGVRLAKDGSIDNVNNCVMIDFIGNSLEFSIDNTISSALCQKLSKIYKRKLTIPFNDNSIKL
ncbi:prepilin-type N-terminal cleavage/methylation domain-containing protein [Helicobacter sp. 13S00477-4]|uniref:prepilin-type N-terminal cleavage/methylation domain-containing protein n=1 Tax=Helicobacter sp. 13S00477-4 TaxID=1905759 RepID=UPI000BA5BD9B|nr:prepilin-type N-terminal cleavage/methylation domain-containing protein [Helicobacter sp. 13S00477-4]PAF52359.1 prepilin-type N-terminal cleavage/methylation domain-containing protein [Helicobacter sp. 13S00477-4]